MVEHMSTTAAYALDDWCYYTRVFQDNWADKLPMMSVSVTARELMRVEKGLPLISSTRILYKKDAWVWIMPGDV